MGRIVWVSLLTLLKPSQPALVSHLPAVDTFEQAWFHLLSVHFKA
jgi:hypothetical protein